MKFAKRYIAGKFTVIAVVVFLFAIMIVGYTLKTMIVDHKALMEVKSRFETDSLIVYPERGNIISDDGQLLASSLPDYKVYVDFLSGLSRDGMQAKGPVTRGDSAIWKEKDSLFHTNLDSICIGLNEICPSKSVKEYRSHLERGWNERKRYHEVCPGQVLNYIQYNQLMNLPFFNEYKHHKYLIGLTIEDRNNRKKPFGSLAKRILGEMYGAKDSARSGIELAYDSLLRGETGIRHRKKVRSKFLDIIDEPAKDGYDLICTINIGMQDICETELRSKLEALNATWGVVILMETKTGDVKSMVNLSRADDGRYYEMRNWALGAFMEPGSTFKTASIMVALDDGEIAITDSVDGNGGYYKMHGSVMTDHNIASGGYHGMDVTHTLMYSSNIGVSRLIDKHYHDKPQQFIDGLHRIGIGEPLGLPFTGVANPHFQTPGSKLWSNASLPWMSIGYNSQLPPISTVTFYNAIANGGKMMRPRFVKATEKNGEVVQEFPPEVMKEHICKQQTLEEIQTALYRVVNDKKGTGKRAGSKLFHISGKTGTAQVSMGKRGYSKGASHLVSFCGYYPSEEPRYTCIVAILYPGHGASGGNMAGPVFSAIAERVMSRGISSDISVLKDQTSEFVPEVMNGNLTAAKHVLDELDIACSETDRNASEWGITSKSVDKATFSPRQMPDSVVPDMKGMGARDAVYAVMSRGMKVRIEGVGKVVSQSVAPGTKVKEGMLVKIKLK